MDEPIGITGIGSISPLGASWPEVDESYAGGKSKIVFVDVDDRSTPVARLNGEHEAKLSRCCEDDLRLEQTDRTVQMAVSAALDAVRDAGWTKNRSIGINVGSSRGATGAFEMHHRAYLQHATHRVTPSASPSTTLGSISSWIGQSLGSLGITFSHSMTCSTAAHAVLNGIAWLRSGMADRFLVGGAEAPLTGFTIAQMRALRIYARSANDFPCRPLAKEPQNSVVLGEGAAVLALELISRHADRSCHATIAGWGYGTEIIGASTSLSADAECLQRSMQMALDSVDDPRAIDAVIVHAPGTARGDSAETAAIREVFGNEQPLLISNKWRIGHTFGASAALSIEFALHLFHNSELFVAFPYPTVVDNVQRPLHRIMVNSTGFGGNAVSLILDRPTLLFRHPR